VRDGFGSSLVITFLGRTTSCCWLAVSAVGEDSNATGVEPSWVDSGIQADNSATNSGAAYLFQNDHPNKDWLEESYIKASNSEENDAYSSGIAISRGGALVVAAMGEDGGDIGVNGDETDNSGADSGAVYVELDPSGHCWKFHVYDACDQTGYIKAANTDSGDRVTSVAIDSDTIVFGAPYEDSNARGVGGDQNNNTAEQSGAVYVIQ
jgi:hypothetical protein